MPHMKPIRGERTAKNKKAHKKSKPAKKRQKPMKGY